MSDRDNKSTGKVILDIELKDLINMVSSSKNPPLSTAQDRQHSLEGEELRKAWFNHMLLVTEKLGDAIQELRTKDMVRLRKELKEDINRIENRVWWIVTGFVGSGVLALIVYIVYEFAIKPHAGGPL